MINFVNNTGLQLDPRSAALWALNDLIFAAENRLIVQRAHLAVAIAQTELEAANLERLARRAILLEGCIAASAIANVE